MLHKIAEFDRDLHTQNVVTKEINELQIFNIFITVYNIKVMGLKNYLG